VYQVGLWGSLSLFMWCVEGIRHVERGCDVYSAIKQNTPRVGRVLSLPLHSTHVPEGSVGKTAEGTVIALG